MQRLTVLLSLSLVMAACAEQFVPVAPSGPVTPFVLSGTVYEHVALRARASGFVQPCSATAVVTGDTTLDVHIVRETVLLTSGIPASMPITEPQISGRRVRADCQRRSHHRRCPCAQCLQGRAVGLVGCRHRDRWLRSLRALWSDGQDGDLRRDVWLHLEGRDGRSEPNDYV